MTTDTVGPRASVELTNLELQSAIIWMEKNQGLVTPYQTPVFSDGKENAWNDYQWNPPLSSGKTVHDPEASEKPLWDNIILAWKNYQIDKLKEQTENLLEKKKQSFGDASPPYVVRQNLTDTDTIEIDGVETHVHGGLDRMTALVNMVEDANEANIHIPHIVMRDEGNQPIQIHTQSEIRKILQAISLRKNKVESAHNLVMQQYQEIANVIDATDDADERLQAAEQANAFIKGYAGHLKTQMDAYNKDALPTDLETLKLVYQERLESHALGRSKYFKGVLSQQGIDLHPSCNDEAVALEKVAAASTVGHIHISEAETSEEAKTAYDNAIAAINLIFPAHTPEFNINNTLYNDNPGTLDVTAASLSVIADHPAGQGLTTPISIGIKIFDEDDQRVRIPLIRTAPGQGETRRGFAISPPTEDIGKTYRIELSARSLCGPTDLTINYTVSSS